MSINEIEAYESLVKEFGQEKAKMIISCLKTLFPMENYVTKDYLEESLTRLESHTGIQIAELKAHTDTQIAELRTEFRTENEKTKKEIEKTKNDILRWLFGMWISLMVFILASIFLKH